MNSWRTSPKRRSPKFAKNSSSIHCDLLECRNREVIDQPALRVERATTYTQGPYVRPARGLPFGPAQRSVCHHPAPSRRYGRGPLHSLRRSKGDKAGRRRRPRPSGGGIGRLKEHFLVALFYGLLTRSQERRRDACIQLAPVPVGIRATLGVRGAAKEREGLLIALWHLPPLEALGVGIVPTHALELCHCDHSAPRLTNLLALLYGYLPRLVAEYTPVDFDYHPGFIHRSAWKRNSANFAKTAFSEVAKKIRKKGIPLLGFIADSSRIHCPLL